MQPRRDGRLSEMRCVDSELAECRLASHDGPDVIRPPKTGLLRSIARRTPRERAKKAEARSAIVQQAPSAPDEELHDAIESPEAGRHRFNSAAIDETILPTSAESRTAPAGSPTAASGVARPTLL